MNIELGWYIPQKKGLPRWVLAVSATHVLFGNGGVRHYERKRKTFETWVTRSKAQLAKPA